MNSNKRVIIGSIVNFRDIGGYPTTNGATKWGKIFRCGLPSNLSADDFEKVRMLGITTVIDLRSGNETVQYPCAFAESDFDYRNIPLTGIHMETFDPNDIAATYMNGISSTDAVPNVMRVIANTEGAVAFHCAGGKDRTGVVAAILLMLAGVDDMDIVSDYQVSNTYIQPTINFLKTSFPDMPMHAMMSSPDYMWRMLELFREKYGSAEKYLAGEGLTSEEIAALRAKLV